MKPKALEENANIEHITNFVLPWEVQEQNSTIANAFFPKKGYPRDSNTNNHKCSVSSNFLANV